MMVYICKRARECRHPQNKRCKITHDDVFAYFKREEFEIDGISLRSRGILNIVVTIGVES